MNFYKFFTILFILFCNILNASNYKVIDVGSDEVKVVSATDINEYGHVAGICLKNSSIYSYSWNEIDGFIFSGFVGNGPGYSIGPRCPPYINNADTVSSIRINDNNDVYYVKYNKLCKNSDNNIIESSVQWHGEIRVNNNGKVVGSLQTSSNMVVLFDENTRELTYIKSPFKYPICAEGINELGWIIASYYDGINFNGILWTPEFGVQVLPKFCPTAINSLGVIAGHTLDNGYTRAVLWEKGQLIDLSVALNIDKNHVTKCLWISYITGINDNNQMSGMGLKSIGSHEFQPVFLSPNN